ncbi:MAG: hypothetical protein FJ088_06165, partial [Deltaproteobacteria bacterium]|nr:hypothetical protein [Deltaproteobacteria bacterium]
MKFFLFISIFAILNCSDSSPAAGEDMPLPAETEKNQSIQIAAESVPPVIPECYPPALRKYSGMDGKFKKASDEFEKKNYKNAAKLFDEFNAAHPDDVLSAEAAFSSARSKIFLQEFDQALETIDNFISGKPGLYFEALAGIELSKI